MERSIGVILVIFAAATACTDPGEFDGDTGGADTLVDADRDGAGADGEDATDDPCGGCSGDTPVCDEENETCVECLSDADCTGEDASICDASSNSCVACEPDDETDWYPDADADGYGDGSAQPTSACEKPGSRVDNAEDCDDLDDTVHPDAEEVCNGRDDDCDGRSDADDEMVPRMCDRQESICQGATVAVCTDEGTEYANCGADQYGDDYRADDGEAWLCDDIDNDCDGRTDEACCGTDETPRPEQILGGNTDQANPVILPAVSGAPDDAAYMVAWSDGTDVFLKHVDAEGKVAGGSGRTSLNVSTITSLDAARVQGEYGVAVSSDDNGDGKLSLLHFDDSLGEQTEAFTVELKARATIDGATAASEGARIWMGYTFEESDSAHDVRAVSVTLGRTVLEHGPIEDLDDGHDLPQGGAPEMITLGDTPTVAWWDADSEKVRGARLDTDTVDTRFNVPIDNVASQFDAEPITLFGHGGEAHLVYPDYTASGESALQYATVGSTDTGDVGGATAITGDTETVRQPSARPVDTDEDGEAEDLLAFWAKGSKNDPALVVGRTSLSSPGQMNERTVKEQGSGLTKPHHAVGAKGAGAVWQQPIAGSSKDIKFAPISLSGVPVCQQ